MSLRHGYLLLPFYLFIVQLIAMSISFYVHLYFDKHYHVAGSWLGRFAWFRRKQQLHFLHHRYADCNFAVVDNFWDWLAGYLSERRCGQGDLGVDCV